MFAFARTSIGRLLFPLLLGLAACGDARVEAERLAAAHGLRSVQVRTDPFVLSTFIRRQAVDQPLVVYVEGDGRAWINTSTPSTDPTPRSPVALWLAARDPSPNVAYVARPCQYAAREADSACASPRYWTGHRFAEEVVAATSQAIDSLRAGGQGGVHLVGFSGGGAIAALVAARRTDVLSLRTVAGNLDHEAFTRLHKVSAMTGSLNPADVAPHLAALPQLHLVGGKDEVVPRAVAESYLRRMGDSPCARVVEVPGMDHLGPWEAAWAKAGVPAC